jgi:hypothetical protein
MKWFDMKKPSTCRLLALDVRPRRFGYAVFEPPKRLLDFGVKRFASAETAVARMDSLFTRLRPTVLLLRAIDKRSRRNRPRTREVLRLLRRVAKRSSVQITSVREREMKNYFCRQAKRTKYQIASSLAVAFPDLLWKLPPRRKAWQAEHSRTPIFDAVALAVAYIASKADAETAQPVSTD